MAISEQTALNLFIKNGIWKCTLNLPWGNHLPEHFTAVTISQGSCFTGSDVTVHIFLDGRHLLHADWFMSALNFPISIGRFLFLPPFKWLQRSQRHEYLLMTLFSTQKPVFNGATPQHWCKIVFNWVMHFKKKQKTNNIYTIFLQHRFKISIQNLLPTHTYIYI